MIGPSETLSIDSTDLERGLTELAAELRKPVGTVLRERSGFFGRYLAEATFPIADIDSKNPDGGSVRARDMGQAAVRRDIARVYVPVSALVNEIKMKVNPRVARAFVKLLRIDPAAAERLLKTSNIRGAQLSIVPWDNGALHARLRNRRGGINRGNKPVIVTDTAALKAYVKSKEKLVGFAKSGWITAVAQVTTRGLGQVSKWIRGQGGPGTGTDATNRETDPHIKLANKVRYIDRAFDQRQYSRVEANFTASLAQAVQRELDALVKKRNARTVAKAGGR